MLDKIASTATWLPHYLARIIQRRYNGQHRSKLTDVYLCICDHFEPYWNHADPATARRRIRCWLDRYPGIADSYRDSQGKVLPYTFFYPEEEYRKEDLDALGALCHAGYGEVEIHLHHDHDTGQNLRRTLTDYKKRLHEKHGLLSVDPGSGEITYGFIHGNWALCNSHKDRRWCGVNEEIRILQETGCYADFTLPSAPSGTQTRKVNSIYFSIDKPGKPKSHDWGIDAAVGKPGEGLLMVQGPLGLDWGRRKFGLLPRVEHSGLLGNFPPSAERAKLWIETGVSVNGAPGHVFIKLYTHGTQEKVMQMLFEDGGLKVVLEEIRKRCAEEKAACHFVSAREMVGAIHGLIGNQR